MLNMRYLLAIAALVFSVCVWSNDPTPAPFKVQQPQRPQQTSSDQNVTVKSPVEVRLLNTGKTPEEEEQDTQERRDKANSDRWMIGLTAVLGVIASLQLIAFIWQGLKMRETVKTMKEDFVATHRPIIRIKHAYITSELWSEKPIEIELVIVNAGITPAIIRLMNVDLLVLPKEHQLPPIPEFKEPAKTIANCRIESGMTLVLPKITNLPSLTDAENTRIRNGDYRLYCFGFVEYEDTENRIRKTSFCRVLNPPKGTGAFSKTGRFVSFNDFDYEYQD